MWMMLSAACVCSQEKHAPEAAWTLRCLLDVGGRRDPDTVDVERELLKRLAAQAVDTLPRLQRPGQRKLRNGRHRNTLRAERPRVTGGCEAAERRE